MKRLPFVVPTCFIIKIHTDYEYDRNTKTYKTGEWYMVTEDYDYNRYNIVNSKDSVPYDVAKKYYVLEGKLCNS